ncbi:hypothetical protein GGR22_000723 [Flavobacterium gossypii]|uniref:Uncharacterized protein n=1 Tax=Flavobacterium gossypii TaxID=1646119 RepID=A0ABR6DLN5_9FLAO|nr:hypothetical protein [Flavobacterium gossypii]MBA9072597.1 hypothetical protein [Flavobacterium gossypii]
MEITSAILLSKKVPFVRKDKVLYFSIEGIRKYYPHAKFPADKIRNLVVGVMPTAVIKPSDIEEMTEFDKNIANMMKFKK